MLECAFDLTPARVFTRQRDNHSRLAKKEGVV
jgi:hypothetical protein